MAITHTTPELFSELAYTYDATFEGLLSAVFAAYAAHEVPSDITPEKNYSPRLGQTDRFIPTNKSHAQRVEAGVERACGRGAFNALILAYLSDDSKASNAIFKFIRHAMAHPTDSSCHHCQKHHQCHRVCGKARRSGLLSALAHPAVEPIFQMMRRVSNERESMIQFLRFEHREGDWWYGRCNPQCNVVPLLMDHFCARFSGASFVIYDEIRHLAGFGTGQRWFLSDMAPQSSESELGFSTPSPTADEPLMVEAWRKFYDTIAVESRFNPELRRSQMPRRFWSHITELQRKGGSQV